MVDWQDPALMPKGRDRQSSCKTCYAIPMTSKAMSPGDAVRVLEKQALAQERSVHGCGALKCFADLVPPAPSLEFAEGHSHGAALLWAASRRDARDVLECGASYGGGSTAVLAQAVKQRYRRVTSIEAVEDRFLYGHRYYSPKGGGKGLPVRLVLGSPVGPDELVRVQCGRCLERSLTQRLFLACGPSRSLSCACLNV